MEICPREAIQVSKTKKVKGENAKQPLFSIEETKCNYCGICEAICPFGALKLTINGKQASPVIRAESFPQLIREIKVDETKLGEDSLEIKDICPLDLIKFEICNKDNITKNIASKTNKKKFEIKINIKKESCPGCRVCEKKLPKNAIKVEKIFYGSLRINKEKCPKGCHDCVDVCPIPGVLTLSKDGDVQINEYHCIYCGTCKITCPENNALELTRNKIRHTEIRSGAWNKALEKIASTDAVIKELENKNARKLRGTILKRFPPEDIDENV